MEKVTTNHRDLAALIAWLEARDPQETFFYGSVRTCLFAQWLQFCGFTGVGVGGSSWDTNEFGTEAMPAGWPAIPNVENAWQTTNTIGSALEQARKLQAARTT